MTRSSLAFRRNAWIALIAISATGDGGMPPRTDGLVADWPYYGADAGGSRYSRLSTIDRRNVAKLRVAWVYHTGDGSDSSAGRPRSEFETTPIVAFGTMYLTTPFNRVVALDPETGKEGWTFDPRIDLTASYSRD